MVNERTSSVNQNGSTLIEVLVAVIILAIGLLGLAGLHTRLQVAEIEAYQRSQALILLNDIASRISANRTEASSYVLANPVGAGVDCAVVSGASTTKERDIAEWCVALQGAGEKSAGGSSVGSMLGARGCVKAGGTAGEYLIMVAWQGFSPSKAPKSSLDCGVGLYNSGSTCTGDQCRRVVSTAIYVAPL